MRLISLRFSLQIKVSSFHITDLCQNALEKTTYLPGFYIIHNNFDSIFLLIGTMINWGHITHCTLSFDLKIVQKERGHETGLEKQ